jgi:hypothetical protein
MSLSARERHALHAIEERLTGSDPSLASRLGMFTRLTSGEAMPIHEKICAGRRRALRHQPGNRSGALSDMGRRPIRRMGRQRAILLLWLLIALALTTTGVAFSRTGGRVICPPPWTVSCAGSPSGYHPRPVTRAGTAGQPLGLAAMSPGRSR